MSGTDYSYDDQGQFFPFFVLTLSAIITVPLTYSLLKPSSDAGATAPRITSDFKSEHDDLVQIQRKKQKRRERKVKRLITVVVGWAVIGFMAYLIHVTARTLPKIWNPYDILGIKETATEKEIKSHYKRMSLKFHPDKVRADPAKNETIESLNDFFVEFTKAYKALTDEDIRNNFQQYGHPDGKQSFSIGIALPKIMVTEGNGKYVLIVYAGLLGVLLPYLVGKWWYGTQALSKEKVLIESANALVPLYEESMTQGDIITALSTGAEFSDILKGHNAEANLARIESRILAESDASMSTFAGGLTLKDRKKLEELDEGVRRKALALLWAYLGRVELDDRQLEELKVEVAPTAHLLTQSMIAITLAYGATTPIMNAYAVAQSLIQAIAPGASPLLQLPHFTPAIAKVIEEDSKSHMTLQQYMAIPEAKRAQLTVGTGLLTHEQYNTAMDIARQLPHLQVPKEGAFFKVVGEKHITPGSLVSLIVKARFVPPGSVGVPEVTKQDLEDVDPEEGDLDALLGRAKKSNKLSVDDSFQPPLAYAPYFARDYSPRWNIFLTDSKQGKIAVPPFTFTTFDKPIFENGKPTFNMQTLKAQFQAPPQAGQYTFVLHLVCDAYKGFDNSMEVTLVVDDASKAEEIEEEEEISEPDEDTLAGQMQAMKSGVPAPKRKIAKKKESDSDEDSDSEEEDEDTTSDTDTDTDTDEE